MGWHIKLVSQSAALTKFIIGIACNSISIAAITMRVVMIVTLHQHGFPTRSILQKRQKIERRFKSQGRREAAQSRPPLVAMVSGVRRYRDRCPCQWRWRWRLPETPPGTPIAASAALGRSMGAAWHVCCNTHGVRWVRGVGVLLSRWWHWLSNMDEMRMMIFYILPLEMMDGDFDTWGDQSAWTFCCTLGIGSSSPLCVSWYIRDILLSYFYWTKYTSNQFIRL